MGFGTGARAQVHPGDVQEQQQADTSRVDSLRGGVGARPPRTHAPSPVDSLDGGAGSVTVRRLAGDGRGPAAASPDTGIVDRYFPSSPRSSGVLFGSRSPILGPRSSSAAEQAVTLDSTGTDYTIDATPYVDGPMRVDAEVYRRESYRSNLRQNWSDLVERRQQQRSERGGFGVSMTVPGGRESAFTTIFGKPQVDLRVNGRADINAGFKYSKNDRQGAATGDATQLDPSFKQDLRLGITGTIGDKMQINVDWDTKSQFDYQNQVKLEYTGYEDEIIQSVEAGNVFLETPSQLISGGQSLFGIKSTFQLGNLSLTTIASQQEGQSNSLSIEGGAETTEFNLKPTDYDEDKHFFLGYYFRNNWNRAHDPQNPSRITTFDGFSQITNVEVWKLQTTRSADDDIETQRIAAVVDLGERPELLRSADAYTETVLPTDERDQYDPADLAVLRDGDTTSVTSYVESSANLAEPLQAQDVEEGRFKKLERGRDYQLDARLGFLSLKQRLRSSEALAVAFEYRANGEVREIGDFSGDQGGSSGGVTADRLVLKLLRPSNPVAPGPNASEEPPTWFLEMRNVYQLGGRDFSEESFQLNVEYSPPGQGATTSLPQIAGQQSLLQMFGLDRVNQSGAPNADNQFDFLEGLTIDSQEGLLYFPYLEPFGERILQVAGENASRSDGESFAFPELYLKKKSNAEKEDTEKNVYQLKGSYKGQAKGFYDLKAFTGLVDGSVEVTSGGQTLSEGTDYIVDYQSGTVNITNQSYLTDGRDIDISYEQQSIANLQKKTLLGARADWSMQDQFALGATVMRLSQKSPVDKYRVGEEPIQNMIWGVDGSMELEPRWLTRAVDALPLVQTRAESSVSLSGEFAQLRPGHTRTEAFQQTIEEVRQSDEDSYAPDERNGVSYLDDFEGFENTFSLREQLSGWEVSAAPDSIAPLPSLRGDVPGNEDDLARSYWRGSFGWYRINRQMREDLKGKVAQRGDPEATELLNIRQVFPNRDPPTDPVLRTLDFYFTPWQRGPYNYTSRLEDFFGTPKRVWGGVTRRLPEGYVDFSRQNVEFVEFIVKVYPQNGQITEGSKLFVNLGTISEDVVPNERLNTEKGLSFNFDESDFDELSRLALTGGGGSNAIEIGDNGRTEDLGLDGLVSYTDSKYDSGLLETTFYADFVDRADDLLGAGGLGLSSAQRSRLEAEVARIKDDPSADDYHHYEDDRYFDEEAFFANDPTLQQRLSRYYAGDELNGFETQNQLAEDVSRRRGISGTPDTEDLDGTGGNVNFNNDYYQYAIPLDSLGLRAQTDEGPTDYVVSRAGREGSNWYKIRIPVRAFTERVGNIQDFTRIESIRFWTMGHAAPVTMRFASLELVGSQWRTSPPVAEQPVERGEVMSVGEGELRVASINNEEDPGYKAPVGAVVSRSRTARGSQQRNREQALLLNVNRLGPGQQRGIFKTFRQGVDLLKYSNLRMYTHVHGSSNDPQTKEKIRENLRLFVRLGSNETSDYYEYEQPLTASNVPGTGGTASPWLERNEMNLLLSALSQLKTARTQVGVPLDTTFTSDRVDLPLDFAPSGTRLKIRGTPSLNRVNTIVIGVRHAQGPGATPAPPVLRNIELWVNELRVSGFDEKKGWATNTSANVSLADLATVQGSFQRQTDGFGSLSSTLDERKQADNMSWSARAEVNLDALLPQQQGWSIPVTMQVQSSRTDPRFDPERGDVRIQEVQDQFDVLPDSTIQRQFGGQYPDQSVDAVRETLKDSVQRASQTYSLQRTVTANLSKNGSDSWWLRKTVDATSLNFSYLNRTGRSPQLSVDEKWSWSGSFDYQLDFGQARTVRPLGFLPDVPVLGALGSVEFNYVPTSLTFSGSADRDVSTRRDRPTGMRSVGAGPNERPVRIAKPFRENQNFSHNRNFSLQYDPFGFFSLGFDTNTQQTLTDVGGRTQQNLIFSEGSVVGSAHLTDVDTSAFFRNPQSFPVSVPDTVTQDDLRGALGETIFVEERLRTRSEGQVFRDLFFGDASPRTRRYNQRLSATLRLGITDRKALNWIDLQDISYQGSFNWNNGAKGSLEGASVQNSVTLRTGVSLHPNKVWERFGFFERMKEAQREAEQEDDEATEQDDSSSDGTEGTDDTSDSEDGDESSESPMIDLPLPDPIGILRRMALTVLDIRDVTVNYNGTRSSRSSNVGISERDSTGRITGVSTNYTLFDAIQGEGPPLAYRLGLSRSIDPQNERVFPEGQTVLDNRNNQHRFEARTALNPSSALNIDLTWNVSWSTQPQIEFQRPRSGPRFPSQPGSPSSETGAPSIERFEQENGRASASAWAFGSYKSFFESQLRKLQSNVESPDRNWNAEDLALTKPSVAADFRNTYLTGGSSIAGHGFVPLPMPGWTVRYSGLSDWPLIKSVTENVSLNHGYNASYETSFSSNSRAGDTTSVPVVGREFNRIEAGFTPQSVRVQERFQPLVGVDITWPWDLQTSFEWSRSITTALRGVDAVTERKTGELSGRITYSKQGLRIPFLPRIENRIRFSLTLTRSVSDEREYFLESALQQAAQAGFSYDPKNALQGDNVEPRSTSRLTLSPEISYTVSNRVTADFRLNYEKFSGNNTSQPSFTNVNGTFNLSVSISQN